VHRSDAFRGGLKKVRQVDGVEVLFGDLSYGKKKKKNHKKNHNKKKNPKKKKRLEILVEGGQHRLMLTVTDQGLLIAIRRSQGLGGGGRSWWRL